MPKQRFPSLLKRGILVKITLTLSLLLILSFPHPITPVHASYPTSTTEVNHFIQITSRGLIIINDTVKLKNEGVEPITSFAIGFNSALAKNLDNATAQTNSGEKMDIRRRGVDENDIYWIRVTFPKGIKEKESLTFSIAFAFSRLITYSEFEPTTYTAYFPKYPALAVEASSCTVEINLPNETTLVESSWGNSTTYIKTPLEENSNQTGYVSFEGTLQYIQCESASREIFIDSWGNIHAQDRYEIRNVGKQEIRELDFPLPSDAEEVVAYDDFGPLTANVEELDGVRSILVSFRYPLRGEVNSVKIHDSYSLTIQYKLKTIERLSQTAELTSFQVKVEVFPSPDWTVEALKVRIVFPQGGEYIHSLPSPTEISQSLFTQSTSYTVKNLTSINGYSITIKYNYNIFWSSFRPTLWIGIATIAVGGVILQQRRRKPRTIPTPSKEIKVIMRFIEVCEERMGLWIELENLEKDFNNRRLRRKDFNRRRRILTQRLSLLNKEVTNNENRVSRIGTRYAELIEKFKEAEVEVQTLNSEMDRLKNRLKRGLLSKNAYNKLREAYHKRIQRARARIEEVIFELKNMVV